ncbi:hypothetical protein HW555_000674 [Spodoptera exigua]|uniref:Uncharacterized protein n=1 Tax=Spodoptera exigua TaxID=7107 RepID=A0A835LG64_SPOEX|nr:hypothetical protein HW555_000674 [Spodoptera exigua]
MVGSKELFNDNFESRSASISSNKSVAEQDIEEQFNMDVITNEEMIRPKKRDREEEEEGWVQSKGKKTKENCIEIYISSKEKLPRQFALARLFKEKDITDIIKVKYLNNYRVRIDCKNELSATKLQTCKDFMDMDWRFSRPDFKSYSYGVIKDVDLDLSDEQLMSCITCPENFELVSLKRLQRRSNNDSPEGLWVTSEAVRLCFKGDMLPGYIYADSLRIKVEPFVFPVSQCSRCWKFGHTVRVCPSKKTLCPKCGSNHANCDTQHFKCLNCEGPHMALSKTCPAFVKEKNLKILMAEFNCTYRKALQLYVAPSPRRDEKEFNKSSPTDGVFPKLKTKLTPTCVTSDDQASFVKSPSSPLYAEVVKTEATIHKARTHIDQQRTKKHEKTRVDKGDDWANWLPTETGETKELEHDPEDSKKKEVNFDELLTRLKNILFLKRCTVGEKIRMAIQCCLEWLILVVVDNVSDWNIVKKLFELFNGQT